MIATAKRMLLDMGGAGLYLSDQIQLYESQDTMASTDHTTSTANVFTPKASQYLQQLCKHFGHKRPVDFDAGSGRIEFDFGTCTLKASPETQILKLVAQAATVEDRARLEDVIARHLLRFAFRESLAVQWSVAVPSSD